MSCSGAGAEFVYGTKWGENRVTLSRLWCYVGIRQVLPGSQSRRCPEAHRRGQPLQSEARNAKNSPESAIGGAVPNRPAPTGSVFWLVPISFPRSAPRRGRRTNLRFLRQPLFALAEPVCSVISMPISPAALPSPSSCARIPARCSPHGQSEYFFAFRDSLVVGFIPRSTRTIETSCL